MPWFAIALTVALTGGAISVVVGAIRVNRRRSTWRRVVTAALLWVWAWGVLAMTFGTRSGGGSALNLKPLDLTNHSDVLDFALNVLMFVPGGVLLAIHGVRLWTSLVIVAGASLAIEAMQYILATGRTADINDLLANVSGFVVGYAIATAVMRIRVRGLDRSQ